MLWRFALSVGVLVTAVGASAQSGDNDPLGTEILSRAADPDFDAVAAKLPPLGKPREIVGVKDHPYEIGVAHDGTIQLPTEGDGWEQKGPTLYFEVGAPPVRFGTGGCKKTL